MKHIRPLSVEEQQEAERLLCDLEANQEPFSPEDIVEAQHLISDPQKLAAVMSKLLEEVLTTLEAARNE